MSSPGTSAKSPDRANPARRTMLRAGIDGWLILLATIALACLVWAVFWPIAGFEFVDFDTDDHVVRNSHIRGLSLENLRHIFTSRCVTSYYPVRTLSYAVDYQIRGLNAGGFKLTNGLIHLGNVLLVFWLVLRLLRHPAVTEKPCMRWGNVLVAAFSAGLLAIHPVVVEPVAWVPGREELLMTLGVLACLHFHLNARRLDGDRGATLPRRAYHLAAVICCTAACLSNVAGAVIPPIVTAWDILMSTSPKLRRIVRGTWALWLIGVATILVKGRDSSVEAMGNLPPIFSADWLRMVLTVYGLNLKTLAWPAELGILYEWVPSYGFRTSELILGGVAIGATLLLLCRLRHRKLAFFGLLWFCLALAPTSQLMPHHIARADRFLYLPLVGLAITVAATLGALNRAVMRPLAAGGVIAAGLLGLLLLGRISAGQIQTWQNSYTMWQNCLRVSPNNPMAHTCFADILARRGQFDKAIPHYHMALRVEPDRLETLNNFALRLGAGDDMHLRDYETAIRLAERGCRLTEWKDPKLRHTLALAHTNLASSLTDDSRFGGAVENYRKAIEADPDYDIPVFHLALLLATCPDQNLLAPDEAVRLAERARQLSVEPDSRRLSILAAVYAASGRFETAASTAREAIELAQAAGQTQMLAKLRSQLEAYQFRSSYPNPRSNAEE